MNLAMGNFRLRSLNYSLGFSFYSGWIWCIAYVLSSTCGMKEQISMNCLELSIVLCFICIWFVNLRFVTFGSYLSPFGTVRKIQSDCEIFLVLILKSECATSQLKGFVCSSLVMVTKEISQGNDMLRLSSLHFTFQFRYCRLLTTLL